MSKQNKITKISNGVNKQVSLFSPLTRRKTNIKLLIVFVFLFSFLFIPFFAQATSTLTTTPTGFLDKISGTCMTDGNCTLENVAEGFIELTKLLIGAIGALALAYFVWGGIKWLTSYGNQQKIQQGREIMLQTVIALVVAFMSYILVEFFVNDLLHGKQCVQVDTVTGECTQYKDAVEVDSSSGGSTTN